jgi:nucleotidyltransferase substrate binding protein (TIGR01987 family)
MAEEIRWIQRFSNFNKALSKLTDVMNTIRKSHLINGELNMDSFSEGQDIIIEGAIQRFEYTYELAWNVMKDYALYQGIVEVGGPRDAIRQAFSLELILNGKSWMSMISSRNSSTHTYNEETAKEIAELIIHSYHQLFLDFQIKMEGLRSGQQSQLDI